MTSRQDIIDYISHLCKGTVFSKPEITQLGSELTILSDKIGNVTKSLIISFRLSDTGMAIQSIGAFLTDAKLESFIEHIAEQNNLQFNKSMTRTVTYSASDLKLYRKITLDEVDDFEVYKKYIQKYLFHEVVPFFKNRSTIEGLGAYVLKYDFDNIINIGLGGEYPINILKAITIAKWCGNDSKYEEYTTGLQLWINEDRNDPNYAKTSESYQAAFNELKEKLTGPL